MNPGLSTKKMSACKWPINNIDLWGGGGGDLQCSYRMNCSVVLSLFFHCMTVKTLYEILIK